MRLNALVLIFAIGVGIPCLGAEARPKLLLISIDGLRPAFYTDAKYRKLAPVLATLSDEGVRAPHGIEPVFPSITYPNHTAMVTGAYSSEHGIYNNRVFDPAQGETDNWNWYEKAIRVPTLWQIAEKAGLHVALIRWPAAVGAKVHWLFPEIFAGNHGFHADEDWAAIRKNTEPDFLKKVLDAGEVKKPASVADIDQIDTQAVEYILKNENADLVLLHLIDLDRAQHQFGTEDPQVDRALQGIDQELKRVLRLIDRNKTTVIVTGDHGFLTYHHFVNLSALVEKAGFKNRILTESDGGMAAIHAAPFSGSKPLNENVCLRLEEAANHQVHAISRSRLDELHAFPDALCGLEADPDLAFWSKRGGQVINSLDHPRGHHGFLPSRTEMRAGFLIWGKGVKPGILKADPKMPDIAPTAAKILRTAFSTPAGRVIGF